MRLVSQGFVFMQDKDSKHTSKVRLRYIKSKEGQYALQLTSWSAQSADLNPIELVWDELDRKVRAQQPTIEVHLRQLSQESRAELYSVYL